MSSYVLSEDLGCTISERAICQYFLETEAGLPAGPMKDVLGLLRSISALVSIEKDTSFLRYGCLTLEVAAAVRNEVTKLCSDLRPNALPLVSLFGIPGAFLGPISFGGLKKRLGVVF